MFKFGQEVVFTEDSIYSGIRGFITDVDEYDPELPYLVEFEDDDGVKEEWFSEEEIKAVEEDE